MIDIREMYQKDGEDRPGKGIALNPEQYNTIKVKQVLKYNRVYFHVIKYAIQNNADDIDKLW